MKHLVTTLAFASVAALLGGCVEGETGADSLDATEQHSTDQPSFGEDELVSYFCVDEAQSESLAFTINTITRTIVFSNIDFLQGAQILNRVHFGTTQSDPKRISFIYDWYYSAKYEMEFEQVMVSPRVGESQSMQLDFNDSDGAFGLETFSCTRVE